MTSIPSLRLVAVAIACASATACASASAPANDEGDEVVRSTDDEVRASCTNPRKYFATLREGSCAPIKGRRGVWVPEPLFADAPAEVASSTCAYRWSGDRYSRPDRQSLVDELGIDSGLAPACGNGADVGVGDIRSIPAISIHLQGGSVGCDVCGIVNKRRVFVVLPPERIALRQFTVHLSNGQQRAFEIGPTEARALTVTLPAPPRGTTYEQGSIEIR